jgi:hypothetical protein
MKRERRGTINKREAEFVGGWTIGVGGGEKGMGIFGVFGYCVVGVGTVGGV